MDILRRSSLALALISLLLLTGCNAGPGKAAGGRSSSATQAARSIYVTVDIRCSRTGTPEYVTVENVSTARFTVAVSSVTLVTLETAMKPNQEFKPVYSGRVIARDKRIPPGKSASYEAPEGTSKDMTFAVSLPGLDGGGTRGMNNDRAYLDR